VRARDGGRRRGAFVAVVFATLAAACSFWDPSRPFEREAPEVNHAIALLDAGDATAAASTLEEYLSTGACDKGSIGAPDVVRRKPNGGLDLGLSLFAIAESFGHRFGDEEADAASPPPVAQERAAQVGCALRIVEAMAGDDTVPLDLRAHARYLEGNLHFLLGEYEEAVRAYDRALTLTPALVDAGDAIARDAAWNRAIALRRIEDKKDAGKDGGDDGGGDGGDGAPPDAGNDSGNDAGKDGGHDAGGDSGPRDASPDGSNEAGVPPPPPPNEPDAGQPPPPKASQDDRILEQLEHAPTVQQEAAKKAAASRRVRGMADK